MMKKVFQTFRFLCVESLKLCDISNSHFKINQLEIHEFSMAEISAPDCRSPLLPCQTCGMWGRKSKNSKCQIESCGHKIISVSSFWQIIEVNVWLFAPICRAGYNAESAFADKTSPICFERYFVSPYHQCKTQSENYEGGFHLGLVVAMCVAFCSVFQSCFVMSSIVFYVVSYFTLFCSELSSVFA